MNKRKGEPKVTDYSTKLALNKHGLENTKLKNLEQRITLYFYL